MVKGIVAGTNISEGQGGDLGRLILVSTVGSVYMCSRNMELLPTDFSTASLILQNRSTVVLRETEESEQMRCLASSSRLCPQNPLFISLFNTGFSGLCMNCENKLCYKKCSLRTFIINITGM